METHILLLEDEEILGRIYSRALQEAGFTVTWRKTVSSLRQSLDKTQADAILLDLGIRGEGHSGLSLIPILKKKFPDAKIAMLSNYSPFQFGEKALKAGANAYWVKLNTPPSDLVVRLQKLLLEKDREQGSAQRRVLDPDLPPMKLDNLF
jgi:two-component system, response regulator RegA